MEGMEALQDLFSGRITVEQYRGNGPHVVRFETCLDCDKEWER